MRLNTTSLMRGLPKCIRPLSTSQTVNYAAGKAPQYTEKTDFTVATVEKSKDWVSYGWDRQDKAHDRSSMKASFFISITFCMIIGGFVWSYLPDRQMIDWAQREGYLVLRQREQAGLPPISPDFVDASTVILPSDESLGSTNIII